MRKHELSILAPVSAEDVIEDPYPHLVIKNALDDDLYSALVECLPDTEVVMDRRPKKDTWYDSPPQGF